MLNNLHRGGRFDAAHYRRMWEERIAAVEADPAALVRTELVARVRRQQERQQERIAAARRGREDAPLATSAAERPLVSQRSYEQGVANAVANEAAPPETPPPAMATEAATPTADAASAAAAPASSRSAPAPSVYDSTREGGMEASAASMPDEVLMSFLMEAHHDQGQPAARILEAEVARRAAAGGVRG